MDAENLLQHHDVVVGFGPKHQTGLVTLLFSDLVDSTALKQKLGDHRGTSLILQHREVVRETLRSIPEGEEIETAGDSFFIVFATPSVAVKFALQVIAQMRQINTACPMPLLIRIGIHLGEVVIENNLKAPKPKDLYGIQVDTCARVMGLAKGAQILMTRGVFDSARQMLKDGDIEGVRQLAWLNHGSYRLKGIDEPLEICEVGEVGYESLSAPTTSEKAHRQVSAEDETVLGWRPAVGQAVPNTQWVLQEQLGEGGFGEVWLASHRQLKEQRVFKFCFWAHRVRSLKREVTLFRLLKGRSGEHPNIVRLYDVCLEHPPFYLEEEYVDGRDLRRWSEKLGGLEQVPLDARLEIVAQAAAALQAAHDAGIIHRDVKPGNILVSGLWNSAVSPATLAVKLTDFGIGQVVSEEALAGITRAGFTQTQMSLSSSHTGTQLYMAPELTAGKPASTRSDIYGLGVVLYQMLVGDFNRPLTTDWTEDVADPLLRDDLRLCVAGNPNERFAGAGQLTVRLHSLNQRRRTLVEQQAHLEARERAAYRRGMLRTAAIATGIFTIIALLAWQARSNALAKFRQAAQIRSTTVRLTVANGLNPAKNGDWLSAGLWFSEAFVLDEAFQVAADARLNRQTHQLRINSLLRQSPRLEQMFFDEDNLPVGFDRTGEHVLLGDTNGYSLYGIQSGQRVSPRVGEGHLRASLRPDGRQVVTGGGGTNSLFTLWDVASGLRFFDLRGLQGDEPLRGDCQDLQFSPDGRWIAAALGGPGGRVVIWDATTGRARQTIAYTNVPNVGWADGNLILSARFDPSGRRLVTTATDHRAVIWQWDTGRPLHVLEGHRSWVYSASFGHRHTNWVVTCSFDRKACLWDLQTEQFVIQKPILQVEHEGDAIKDVQFSPDDRLLLTGGLDSTVRFWETETGRMHPPILRNHDRVMQVEWSAAGSRVLARTWDGVTRVWHLDSESAVQLTSSDFSSDGRLELTHDGGIVRLKASAAGHQTTARELACANLSAVQFAGGTNRFLSFSRRPGSATGGASQIQLWDFANKAPVGSPLNYDPSWSKFVCASDGRRLAFFNRDNQAIGGNGVLVWEPARGSATRRIAFDGEVVECAAFDNQGRQLVIGSLLPATDGGVLRLVDLESAKKPTVLLRSKQRFAQASFSGDDQWLATACWDKTLDPGDACLWRVPGPDHQFGQAIRLPHLDGVLYTAFSDSARMLATASEDQTAKIWFQTNGTWVASLGSLGCGGEVYACRFSRNNRWLATAYRTPESQQIGSWGSHVRVWDVAHSEPVSLPFAFSGMVTKLEFVANDTRLFVERWVPPAPPQRWLIDLALNDSSAQESLLRAELLSAQRSFLNARDQYLSPARKGTLSAGEALVQAVTTSPLRPLSKEECRELWLHLTSRTD